MFIEGMWLKWFWNFLEAFLELIAVTHFTDFKASSN
jgi:hypothetical protein